MAKSKGCRSDDDDYNGTQRTGQLSRPNKATNFHFSITAYGAVAVVRNLNLLTSGTKRNEKSTSAWAVAAISLIGLCCWKWYKIVRYFWPTA